MKIKTIKYFLSTLAILSGLLFIQSCGSKGSDPSPVDQMKAILIAGDGLPIAIEEATATKLVLKFNWDQNTLGSGRNSSVKGQNIFTFGK